MAGRRPLRRSSQRPRPGHEGKGLSVSQHGPEGRRPALRARLRALGVGDLEPEWPVELLLSFLALAEGPQHGLLGTGVRGLLQGCASVQAPFALGRGDHHGHRAADALGVAGIPEPLPPESLLAAGQVGPREGTERRPAGQAPPSLGRHRPADPGVVQAGRRGGQELVADPAFQVVVSDSALIAAPLVAGGPGRWRLARPVGGRQRGLASAQVAAHDHRAAAAGPSRGTRLPDGPAVCGRDVHWGRLTVYSRARTGR